MVYGLLDYGKRAIICNSDCILDMFWHSLSNSRFIMTTLDTVVKTWVFLSFIAQYVSALTFSVKTVGNKWAGGVTQRAPPEKAGSAHR